jgi:DNA polymerase
LRSGASGADMIDWCEMGPVTPMRAIGKCTRAMIRAGDGHDLIGCDYSNVEGRGSAWLASEHWKLEAFRAYDEGTGPDLYKVAYSGSFGVPVDQVTKPLRQIGKVQELALGYQGGVGAFMSMGANLGIKPQALFDTVAPIADSTRWSAAADKYQGSTKFGLPEEHWTALRYVVDGWRAAHPKIVQCWWDIQDAVIQAVWEPGEMVFLFGGKIRVYCTRDRRFLYIYLPSGRPLAYFKPRLEKNSKDRWQVVVEGNDSRTNTWGDVYLYGGLLWENCVQALCRDLLVHGMMICERNGYPVVLHVHDEGVYEVPEGEGDVAEVQRMMAILPKWAAGFPLASAAWRDKRYVK